LLTCSRAHRLPRRLQPGARDVAPVAALLLSSRSSSRGRLSHSCSLVMPALARAQQAQSSRQASRLTRRKQQQQQQQWQQEAQRQPSLILQQMQQQMQQMQQHLCRMLLLQQKGLQQKAARKVVMMAPLLLACAGRKRRHHVANHHLFKWLALAARVHVYAVLGYHQLPPATSSYQQRRLPHAPVCLHGAKHGHLHHCGAWPSQISARLAPCPAGQHVSSVDVHHALLGSSARQQC
jgi:hypothetical protein